MIAVYGKYIDMLFLLFTHLFYSVSMHIFIIVIIMDDHIFENFYYCFAISALPRDQKNILFFIFVKNFLFLRCSFSALWQCALMDMMHSWNIVCLAPQPPSSHNEPRWQWPEMRDWTASEHQTLLLLFFNTCLLYSKTIGNQHSEGEIQNECISKHEK